MKNRFSCFPTVRGLVISAVLLGFLQSYSQVRVTKVATSESLTGKKGVVYALPRTLVSVNLEVTRSQVIPGPLAEFAKEFLGVNDVSNKSAVTYSLGNASVNTTSEPDPLQVYLIEKEEKSSGEIWISFVQAGPVMAMEKFLKDSKPQGFTAWDKELYITPQSGQLFKKYSDASAREVIDTLIRKISIDTLVIEQKVFKRSMVGFSDREKALDASDRIKQIEQDKYNLLVGYQETAYSKEALEFMYNKLEEERQEYYKLFTGVIVHEKINFRFEVIPDAVREEQEYIITGFSATQGIVKADDQNAVVLSLKWQSGIPGFPESSSTATTGLVYRIPQPVQASVNFHGKEVASQNIEVLQFGPTYALPPEFKRVEFDLEKGTLKTVILE